MKASTPRKTAQVHQLPTPLPPDRVWEQQLLTVGEARKPRPCLGNMLLFLQHHPLCKHDWWFDTFANRPMVDQTPLAEEHIDRVVCNLHSLGMPLTRRKSAEEAAIAVCRTHPRDPLRTWCDALPAWDGTKRLGTYLREWLGCKDDAYTVWVGRMLLLAMIDRVYHPGGLVRYVVILEGPEALGKSSFSLWLASREWYAEFSVSMDAKDAHLILQGRWLLELADLASLSKTGEQRLKSFLTLQKDDYIPKYSNLTASHARRCVFIGTHNPEGPYFKSQTGNTRFLPILCTKTWHEPTPDERLQLFAEAKQVYQRLEEPWWLVPHPVEGLWQDAREERREASVYEDALGAWLARRPRHGLLTWPMLADQFLGLERKEQWKDKALQMEIAKAMVALGYTRAVDRSNKHVLRHWVKAEPQADDEGQPL